MLIMSRRSNLTSLKSNCLSNGDFRRVSGASHPLRLETKNPGVGRQNDRTRKQKTMGS
jgi:hypothetical protein